MKTLLALSSFIILFYLDSKGQIDSSVNLKEVQISSSRLLFNSGLQQFIFDSLLQSEFNHASLSELLDQTCSGYLKNYGPGELSTLSLRGGSAYHTTILWNGFSLSSPMHGLTDLSLEKNLLFEDESIQIGATSALWGSGSVSGSIHLNNKPAFGRGFLCSAGIAAKSFSGLSEYGCINWGNNKVYTTLKFYNDFLKNNFTYFNDYTNTNEEQIHSRIKQYGFLNENYLLLGKYSTLNLRIWHAYSDRQIPPAINQVNSDGLQKDVNTRLSAEWKYAALQTEYILRSALFFEKLEYNDDFLFKPSNNNSKTNCIEFSMQKHFLIHHLFQAGINHTFSVADSSANFNKAQTGRLALFALYRFSSPGEKIDFSIGARKEFSTLKNSPFIFSAGSNIQTCSFLQFRLAASTIFRNPTLNDLFWVPGGNKNLKPETGFSAEAGADADVLKIFSGPEKTLPSSLMLTTTVFYKQVNDWIIWYPSSALTWIPQNLLMVKSRGLECELKYKYNGNKITAGCNTGFYYTRSTNEKTKLANDASLYQQLIYVPVYKWNSHMYFLYKDIGLNIHYSYTGTRYTSSDNFSFLKPYWLVNMEAEKTFHYPGFGIKLFIGINNLFNINYQSIQNRPMPLYSYEGGISFSLTRSNPKSTSK